MSCKGFIKEKKLRIAKTSMKFSLSSRNSMEDSKLRNSFLLKISELEMTDSVTYSRFVIVFLIIYNMLLRNMQ